MGIGNQSSTCFERSCIVPDPSGLQSQSAPCSLTATAFRDNGKKYFHTIKASEPAGQFWLQWSMLKYNYISSWLLHYILCGYLWKLLEDCIQHIWQLGKC